MEGYAQIIKQLEDTDANCGMSNSGVECPKIDGVYFTVLNTSNVKAAAFIKSVNKTNAFLMGCPTEGTIKYDNQSDKEYKTYIIDKEGASKLLSATKDKPVRMQITKELNSYGKDAPPCYSQFTTYRIID